MRVITVAYHHEGAQWWADSADLPGFTAGADTLQEARNLAVEGVAFYLDDAEHRIAETLDGAQLVSSVMSPAVGADWFVKHVSSNSPFASVRAGYSETKTRDLEHVA